MYSLFYIKFYWLTTSDLFWIVHATFLLTYKTMRNVKMPVLSKHRNINSTFPQLDRICHKFSYCLSWPPPTIGWWIWDCDHVTELKPPATYVCVCTAALLFFISSIQPALHPAIPRPASDRPRHFIDRSCNHRMKGRGVWDPSISDARTIAQVCFSGRSFYL